MRSIIIKVLNFICPLGVALALITGFLGFLELSPVLFNLSVGSLIGLLGSAANLVVLLAVFDIQKSMEMRLSPAMATQKSKRFLEKGVHYQFSGRPTIRGRGALSTKILSRFAEFATTMPYRMKARRSPILPQRHQALWLDLGENYQDHRRELRL